MKKASRPLALLLTSFFYVSKVCRFSTPFFSNGFPTTKPRCRSERRAYVVVVGGRKITARETLAQGKITVPIASDCTRLLSPQTQPIRALSTLVQGRLLRLGDTVVVESR